MAHKYFSDWTYSIAQIVHCPGQRVDCSLELPAPEGIGDEVVGVEPGDTVHVEGAFDAIIDGLMFLGEVSAQVHAECTRCLKEISGTQIFRMRAYFPYDVNSGRDSDQQALAAEDEAEDIYPLINGQTAVDFEPIIRDALVDQINPTPLCSEDCLGLCSQCGIPLEEDPEHSHDNVDPRFAALSGWQAS